MFAADEDFIEAIHAIYGTIEDEYEASREGAKAWSKAFLVGRKDRIEAVNRLVEGLDPK
jgi:hypothetical protein